MSEASSNLTIRLKEAFVRAGAEDKTLHEELSEKLSKSDADQQYLGINGKAASASQADNATSAVNAVSATVAESASKDSDGNVISETYAKKSETGLADSGVTAGSYGPTANAAPAAGGTFTVPQVTVNAKGQVISAASRTITIPSHATTAGTANKVAVANVQGLAVSALTYTKSATSYSATITVSVSRDAYGRLSGLEVSGSNCNCNCNCNCDCADSDTDG